MRALKFLAIVVALASPAQAGSLPDPIAPAGIGKLQCYAPDTSHKTCNSLASYTSGPNGTFDNRAIVLVSKNPIITVETVSPVEIKADQVCGKIREQDIDAAKFAAGDHVLDKKQAEPLRQNLKRAFKDIFDHEIYTAYVRDGSTLVAKATMDAVAMPGAQRVIWVSPDEGYRVGP